MLLHKYDLLILESMTFAIEIGKYDLCYRNNNACYNNVTILYFKV